MFPQNVHQEDLYWHNFRIGEEGKVNKGEKMLESLSHLEIKSRTGVVTLSKTVRTNTEHHFGIRLPFGVSQSSEGRIVDQNPLGGGPMSTMRWVKRGFSSAETSLYLRLGRLLRPSIL